MECPKCGMGYVPEIPEDGKAHRRYHDRIVNGVYAKRAKSDVIVWEKDDYRIAVVNYFSPLSQKIRAENIGLVAHRDTPFDFAPYHSEEPLDERNIHLFLLYKKNRIIGLLIVEKREYVQKFTWKEYENAAGQELPKADPIWSIGLAWVHQKHRKKGFGKQLIQVAASYFKVGPQSIGWYTPFTDEGERLAKCICSEYFYVAK